MTEGERQKNKALNLLERCRACLLRTARRAMVGILLERGEATADDVRDLVPLPDGIKPAVFGAVPKPLANAGIITKGKHVRSRRKAASARDIPVWKLIDRAGAIAWLQSNPALELPGGLLNSTVTRSHQTQLFNLETITDSTSVGGGS